MTGRELFRSLSDHVAPVIEQEFHRRDLCILTARVVIDVAHYFGIACAPLPVRVLVANRQYAERMKVDGFTDDNRDTWYANGEHSVGIGFGSPEGRVNAWNGHLIVTAGDCFGDFSVWQAERPEKGIITGPAILGPYRPEILRWSMGSEDGTELWYGRIQNQGYLYSPDWRDPKRRHRLVGQLIRLAKAGAQARAVE